jgi:deoxyadenosine/deoxycytidine kinase
VVVGPCASGKTTLVERLRALGYDARVSGQEHSAVRDLWRRTGPDVVIALDVDLATIRRRRSPEWSEQIYRAQRQRLERAFAAADLMIDTGEHDEDAVVALVTAWLAGPHHA